MKKRLIDLQEELTGDPRKATFNVSTEPSVLGRMQRGLFGGGGTYGPTKTHKEQLEIGLNQFKEIKAKIDPIFNREIPALYKKLEDAGVPWSRGRPIPAMDASESGNVGTADETSDDKPDEDQ